MCDGRGTPSPPVSEADQLSLYRRNLVDLHAENTRLREEVALLRAIATSVIAESMHSARA
jgi:hypothetical protein